VIHLVMDNGSSHVSKATKAWLAEHTRFVVHYTPKHASWLNQVELVSSVLTRRLLKRGEFASRDDLVDKWCLAGRASARCPPTKPVPMATGIAIRVGRSRTHVPSLQRAPGRRLVAGRRLACARQMARVLHIARAESN
jgi:hypothetical protein